MVVEKLSVAGKEEVIENYKNSEEPDIIGVVKRQRL